MLLKSAGREHPLAVVFTGMACGICVIEDTHARIFTLIILALLFSWRRLPHMLMGFLAGLLVAWCAPHTVWLEGEHDLSGRIESAEFDKAAFRIVLDDVRIDGNPRHGQARLSIYQQDSIGPDMTGGDLAGRYLRGRVVLSPPRPLGNSGEFDYARSLIAQGITVTGYIRDVASLKVAPGKRSYRALRDIVIEPSRQVLSRMARPEAEVLQAILWGDRSGLTPGYQDRFAALGLSHLIAISGLNIGLMVLFGYALTFNLIRMIPWLAGRLDTPLTAKIMGLACAVVFAYLVEPSYPTTRSILMTLVVIAALLFARRTNLLDALALSGCIILLIWPLSLFTASFLLSFAAVLGLVLTLERLKATPFIIQILAVPVAATAFTLPLAAYLFGFVAPLGILYNLIFVPLFSFLVMPFGLLGLATNLFFPKGATLCFACAMDVINGIFWTGAHLGQLAAVPRTPAAWVFLCYLGMILAFFGHHERYDRPAQTLHDRRYRYTRGTTVVIICCILVIIPIALQVVRIRQPLSFDFISVGQGDCTLITCGRHAILIDAGGAARNGFDTGRLIVAPHLLRRGITRLDLAVLTHSHPDHVGGMPFILERFTVDRIWTNVAHDPGFDDVTRIAASKSIPVHPVRRGNLLKINGLKIEVLHPQVDHDNCEGLDLNLHSIVLRIGDGTMTGLFMADACRFGELTLVHSDQDLHTDILKVAHHGSARSCQDLFLEAVRPRLAVIPCGYGNRYGMPDPEVLERLAAKRIRIYRTDTQGEVQINANQHGAITVKSKGVCAEID